VPPAQFTSKLDAPPKFTATTVPGLVADDRNRMRLLGVCVIENNAKADYIGGKFTAP
jgi:hypothetical protein